MLLIFCTLRLFMMTANLFVIANVKQMRTGGSFRILLSFSEKLAVLASQIQQFLTVFTIGLCLSRFWRAFGISGGGGGLNLPKPPPSVLHSEYIMCCKIVIAQRDGSCQIHSQSSTILLSLLQIEG